MRLHFALACILNDLILAFYFGPMTSPLPHPFIKKTHFLCCKAAAFYRTGTVDSLHRTRQLKGLLLGHRN